MNLYVYKDIGQTPLELINTIKIDNDKKIKYSYAGRLDPMARGQMIILQGIECKSKDNYF